MSKEENQNTPPRHNSVDFGSIFTMLVAMAIVSVIGIFSGYAPNIIKLFTDKSLEISQPDFVKSDFANRDEIIKSQEIVFDHRVTLLSEPIYTPPYVMDPEKLKQYLISKSVAIKVVGVVKNAYLYIKTNKLDLEKESVSFYIVDGKTVAGHLFAPESLYDQKENEFLYNLSKLPLVKLPYSSKLKLGDDNYRNVVKEIFNSDVGQGKHLYIGGFVSTTKLPNAIEQIEVRYSCVNNANCQILKEW